MFESLQQHQNSTIYAQVFEPFCRTFDVNVPSKCRWHNIAPIRDKLESPRFRRDSSAKRPPISEFRDAAIHLKRTVRRARPTDFSAKEFCDGGNILRAEIAAQHGTNIIET